MRIWQFLALVSHGKMQRKDLFPTPAPALRKYILQISHT